MCAVCPATGVAVPRWIRARQVHSLPFVDSMRTSLHLFQTGADTGASSASTAARVDCDVFEYVGNAVHHTASRAARGILFAGLRNDYSYDGAYGGRTAIMFNAFGPGDVCENAHQRRRCGDVRVSIDMPYWWRWCGQHANAITGVRLFATSTGALIFSNTVISTRCIHRVLMRYDVNYHHVAEDMTGCDIPGCGRMWCQIWQSGLVDHCGPPEERVIDGIMCHYSLMSTLAEVPTPQMGLAPRVAVAGSLADRTPWIIDSEMMNDWDVASIRREHPEECAEYRMEALDVSKVFARACGKTGVSSTSC
jgi:hypothetical protein